MKVSSFSLATLATLATHFPWVRAKLKDQPQPNRLARCNLLKETTCHYLA